MHIVMIGGEWEKAEGGNRFEAIDWWIDPSMYVQVDSPIIIFINVFKVTPQYSEQ